MIRHPKSAPEDSFIGFFRRGHGGLCTHGAKIAKTSRLCRWKDHFRRGLEMDLRLIDVRRSRMVSAARVFRELAVEVAQTQNA